MIDEISAESIISALTNLTRGSICLKDLCDFLAGESTRIMNIYNSLINDNQNYKYIYDKAELVCNEADNFCKQIENLCDLIRGLLFAIGGEDEEEQDE